MTVVIMLFGMFEDRESRSEQFSSHTEQSVNAPGERCRLDSLWGSFCNIHKH